MTTINRQMQEKSQKSRQDKPKENQMEAHQNKMFENECKWEHCQSSKRDKQTLYASKKS